MSDRMERCLSWNGSRNRDPRNMNSDQDKCNSNEHSISVNTTSYSLQESLISIPSDTKSVKCDQSLVRNLIERPNDTFEESGLLDFVVKVKDDEDELLSESCQNDMAPSVAESRNETNDQKSSAYYDESKQNISCNSISSNNVRDIESDDENSYNATHMDIHGKYTWNSNCELSDSEKDSEERYDSSIETDTASESDTEKRWSDEYYDDSNLVDDSRNTLQPFVNNNPVNAQETKWSHSKQDQVSKENGNVYGSMISAINATNGNCRSVKPIIIEPKPDCNNNISDTVDIMGIKDKKVTRFSMQKFENLTDFVNAQLESQFKTKRIKPYDYIYNTDSLAESEFRTSLVTSPASVVSSTPMKPKLPAKEAMPSLVININRKLGMANIIQAENFPPLMELEPRLANSTPIDLSEDDCNTSTIPLTNTDSTFKSKGANPVGSMSAPATTRPLTNTDSTLQSKEANQVASTIAPATSFEKAFQNFIDTKRDIHVIGYRDMPSGLEFAVYDPGQQKTIAPIQSTLRCAGHANTQSGTVRTGRRRCKKQDFLIERSPEFHLESIPVSDVEHQTLVAQINKKENLEFVAASIDEEPVKSDTILSTEIPKDKLSPKNIDNHDFKENIVIPKPVLDNTSFENKPICEEARQAIPEESTALNLKLKIKIPNTKMDDVVKNGIPKLSIASQSRSDGVAKCEEEGNVSENVEVAKHDTYIRDENKNGGKVKNNKSNLPHVPVNLDKDRPNSNISTTQEANLNRINVCKSYNVRDVSDTKLVISNSYAIANGDKDIDSDQSFTYDVPIVNSEREKGQILKESDHSPSYKCTSKGKHMLIINKMKPENSKESFNKMDRTEKSVCSKQKKKSKEFDRATLKEEDSESGKWHLLRPDEKELSSCEMVSQKQNENSTLNQNRSIARKVPIYDKVKCFMCLQEACILGYHKHKQDWKNRESRTDELKDAVRSILDIMNKEDDIKISTKSSSVPDWQCSGKYPEASTTQKCRRHSKPLTYTPESVTETVSAINSLVYPEDSRAINASISNCINLEKRNNLSVLEKKTCNYDTETNVCDRLDTKNEGSTTKTCNYDTENDVSATKANRLDTKNEVSTTKTCCYNTESNISATNPSCLDTENGVSATKYDPDTINDQFLTTCSNLGSDNVSVAQFCSRETNIQKPMSKLATYKPDLESSNSSVAKSSSFHGLSTINFSDMGLNESVKRQSNAPPKSASTYRMDLPEVGMERPPDAVENLLSFANMVSPFSIASPFKVPFDVPPQSCKRRLNFKAGNKNIEPNSYSEERGNLSFTERQRLYELRGAEQMLDKVLENM